MSLTQGTGVFPGSSNDNIKIDFFLESVEDMRSPNQFVFRLFCVATYDF